MENLHPVANSKYRRCESLPGEIIHEILLRLPAKSVARFRSVCTSWRSITTDCSFLRAHCHCAPKSLIRQPAVKDLSMHRSNFIAFPICDFDRLGSAPELFVPADVFRFGRIAAIGKELSLPEKLHSTCVRPLASCDGLVLVNTCKRGFYVLNPLTSQCTSLPMPHFHLKASPKNFGFYFHRWTGEYRLLSLYVDSLAQLCRPEVLSLGSKSWRKIKPFQTIKLIDLRDCPVYVDDFLHWIYIGPPKNTYLEILVFDTKAELFTMMAVPPLIEDWKMMLGKGNKSRWSFKLGLVDIEARLGFYTLGIHEKRVKVDIWLMEDYVIKRWTKFYSVIYNIELCLQQWNVSFDLHAKDGDLLLVFDLPHKRFVIRCSMKSGKYYVDEVSTDAFNVALPTLIYKESLIYYDSFWNRSTQRKYSRTSYKNSYRKSLKGYGKCVKDIPFIGIGVHDGCLRFQPTYDHRGTKHPYCAACKCHVDFHVDERRLE